MKRFETQVQYLRYQVLREVARHAFSDTLLDSFTTILHMVAPGPKPTMRCCVYKERAILAERINVAIQGVKDSDECMVEVIDIACDECPAAGYQVSTDCRGCIAHRCREACPRDAIYFDEHQKAHIDKSKCIECGRCANVCPYSAINDHKRPCVRSCKAGAISVNENDPDAKVARIDKSKCTNCGACVTQCPFGAITDKTYLLAVIDMLKKAMKGEKKVYALIAPAIASQFRGTELAQVVSGIKALGFSEVVEVALGADMVAASEARELVEKGFLTSSCCPAFVSYIEKHHPHMMKYVSHNLSPMAMLGKVIKERDPEAYTVFIGPCIAKKSEILRDDVKPHIDAVLTFEELRALLDAREIDLEALEPTEIGDASSFGRTFARSGGVSAAVQQAIEEQGLDNGFVLKPIFCSGLDECRTALIRAAHNSLGANFIEGMACTGGCIGGAGNLFHDNKSRGEVDKYGKAAGDKTITQAIDDWKTK